MGLIFADGKGNAIKPAGMYYADGEGNATKIYSSYLPVGTTLYNFNSRAVVLSPKANLGNGNVPGFNVQGIQSSSLTLTNSITKCPNGIVIKFKTRGVINDSGWSSNTYKDLTFDKNPVNISKSSSKNTANFIDQNKYEYNTEISVSNNIITFETNANDGTAMSYYYSDGSRGAGTYLAIESIIVY